MKFITATLAILLSFTAVSSDYQTEIDNFFALYTQGEIVKAVDSIYRTNEYVSAIPDQIKNVKTQMSALAGLVGNINNIDKIDIYKVGGNFVHVTYLVTYDRQPVRFEFQFFKVKSGWRVYSFSFDDDLTQEISVLARKAALISQK